MNTIITIGRQFGSAGREIGQKVAAHFGIKCYDKELLSRVEELVDEVADTFHDFPSEICDELNRLTGNDWTGDNYIEYCAEYWESFWTLEEVVFALFHDGDYPDKTEEDWYAWNIGQSIDEDEDVIVFFRFGEYEDENEKCSKYGDVDVRQLYKELLVAFPAWNNDVDSWEDDDYETFMCTNKETYGFEKEINIYNGYEQKFLACTLTNMNKHEKDLFIKIVQKYCNHVATDEEK